MMRITARLAVWTLSFCILSFFVSSVSSASAQTSQNRKYVPGQILVKFRPGTRPVSIQTAHRALAADVVASFPGIEGLQLVKIAKPASLGQAIASYRANPDVAYAEPNYIVHALQTPNDPLLPNMWSLVNTGQLGGTPGADIKAAQAWNVTTGSSSVVIAVIDSGVDYTHPDLAANIINAPICPGGSVCHGFNTISGAADPNDPLDDNGHGTHVSGTIGAVGNNGLGTTGINWNVTILPCKFLDAQGAGDTAAAIGCLDKIKALKDAGMNIVASNNSWGGGPFSQALQDAIDRQRQSGILFIAAAGNDFSDNDLVPEYPANFPLPNVISVAATDRNDTRAAFSNFGRHTVHLGAPGRDILSTFPGGTYFVASGTSMAAPHVTGVAALLAAQDPTRDWRAIKNLLFSGGDLNPDLSDTISGRRLNAFSSLTCVNKPLASRLLPASDIVSGSSGIPLALSVLNINCGQPGGPVQATVTPGGQTITLADDGAAPDIAAGDGVYTGSFVPPAAGVYTLTFSTGDVLTVQVLNNYQAATTSFSYRNIAGTSLNLGDDDVGQIVSPFPIAFGNGTFTQLWASANGTISFNGAFSVFVNDLIPTNASVFGPPHPATTLVAPFWDDLLPLKGTAQNVFWDVVGVAPNRELVIEWRDVKAFECSTETGTVRFQVVFFENSSDVLFNYADTVFGGTCTSHDRGASATVGIQVGPQLGTMWSFVGQDVDAGIALLWHISDIPPATGTPQILSVSPNVIQDLSPDTIITVTGSGFVPQSRVTFFRGEILTTFVSSTELKALIPADQLDLFIVPGSQNVRVINPGGISSLGAVPITISPLPNPTITSLSPSSVAAGSFSFQLTVTGANFERFSIVNWNGQPLQTFVTSRTKITALVFGPQIATPGTAQVQVVTPGPGGGSSPTVPFNITAGGAAPVQAGHPFVVFHGPHATTPIGLGSPLPATRFLGWNFAKSQGPEYLKRFARPYASQFTSEGTKGTKAAAQPGSPVNAAVVPPPLVGLGLRPSLLAGFLPSGIVAGDFNRDGHMDWVVSNGGSNDLWIYFGNGDGTAQAPRIISLTGQTPVAIGAADLRGNGILDLIVAEIDSATVGVLLGNGDGTFQPETTYFAQDLPLSLAVADLNGDGHLDVLVGMIGEINALASFPGDGTGRLGKIVNTPIQGSLAVLNGISVADINKDGIPDVIVANLGPDGGVETYLGKGDGSFKRFQQVLESVGPGEVYLNAALGDLNGDGCPDFVTITQFGGTQVGLGNCDGTFRFTPFQETGEGEAAVGMLLADINGDGKLDLITGGVNLQEGNGFAGAESGSLVSVQLGDGLGGFELAHVYRGQSGIFALAVADLNGDGHPEIIAPSQDTDSVTVFMNDGTNNFGDPQGVYTGWLQKGNTTPGGVVNPNDAIYAFDVNGDGFKDLVLVDFGQDFPLPHALSVKLNDGTGHFLPEARVAVMDGSLRFGDLAHGDFRHTGREDILMVPTQFTPDLTANQFTFVPNQGAGVFGPPVITTIAHPPGALAVGDFNGDGNLDFAMVGFPGTGNGLLLSVFLGNGDGTFRTGATQLFDGDFPPPSVFAGDFNGDGKLDLMVGANSPTTLGTLFEFLGNGDGTFAPARAVLTGVTFGTDIISQFFAAADLNGDGRTDIVQVSAFFAPAVFNIYLAQPDGSLVLAHTYAPYSGEAFLPLRTPLQFASDFLGDFNGDGKIDIAAYQINPAGRYVQFLLGNGDGSFTPSFNAFPLGSSIGAPSVIADFNNDGRADLLELDGLAASYHVIKSVPGVSVGLQFDSLPIVGGKGAVRVSLALPAAQDTFVQLGASDPGITIPASATIAAGSVFQDVNFQVAPGFDTSRTFSITAVSGTENATALASVAVPGAAVGMVPLLQSSSQAVLAGNTTSDYQFGVNSRGGYQTIVNLTCQGLPAQASCVFGANPLVLPAGGGTGTSLKVTTTTGLAIGDYNFNVVAADASITQTIPAVMHVGDFTLDLASDGTPIPLPSGDTGFALTIGSVNQFGGNVTLALTGLPAGTTHGLTPVSSPGLVQRFGVLTSNVPAGNYPFVITGTNGVVSKTVAGTLRVGDFNSAGITPSTATLNVGQSANFTVKLNSVNGFAGPLGLVCSPTINGQSVAGVQCLFTPQPATFDASGTLAAQMAVTVVSRPKSQTVPRRAAATKPPGDFRLLFVFAIVLPAGLLMSRSNRRRAGVAFFGTVALFLLVSCGGGGGSSGGPPPPPPPPPPPQNVVITINAQGQAYTKTVGSVTVTVP